MAMARQMLSTKMLTSIAIEDNVQINPALLLSLGLGRHELRPGTVFNLGNPYSLPGTKAATDAQFGLFYDWSDAARFYTSIAKKRVCRL
jgi:iron complex outermembrane receptor protein